MLTAKASPIIESEVPPITTRYVRGMPDQSWPPDRPDILDLLQHAEPEVRAWWRDASTLSAAAAAAVKLKHRSRRAASRLTLLGLIELARDALPGKARRRFRRTVADVYESSAALLALMERRQRGRSSRSR